MQQSNALMIQAQQHVEAGHFDDAASVCKQLLEIDPANKIATVLLAQIAFQRDQIAEAGTLLQRAIEQDPSDAYLYAYLSQVLIRAGQTDNAIKSYHHALSLKPDLVDARIALGNLLIRMGRYDEAIPEYQQVLLVRDNQAPVFYNMAIAQAATGDTIDALESYEKAISLKPDYDAAYFNMANLKRLLGDLIGAIEDYRQAANLVPQQKLYWQQFANSLRALNADDLDDALETDILLCLRVDGIEHRGLARHVAALTMRKYIPEDIHNIDPSSRKQALLDAVRNGALTPMYRFESLLLILTKSLINDCDFEMFLTDLRHAFLHMWARQNVGILMEEDAVRFIASLAQQCFLNEYVFYQEQEECSLLGELRSAIESALDSGNRVSDGMMALLSCYVSLGTVLNENVPSSQASGAWHQSISPLISLQVSEPAEERKLEIDLPVFTEIDTISADPVRRQYEVNPYPRWISLPYSIPRPASDVLGQPFPHLLRGGAKFSDSPRILVAGCGTGRDAMMTAMRFIGSNVMAIDISRPSLAFAVRQARKLGISNIEFCQGDVMQLGDFSEQFDIIEAVGILHHLADPLAGWKHLCDRLCPRGFMKVGLYSELGRHSVRAAQKLAKEWRLGPSANDIRLFRNRIMKLDIDIEARELTRYTDFFSLSGCRDLAFHEREQWYTLPEIEYMLAELGLEFVGFELEESAHLHDYLMHYPDDPDAIMLGNWHQFELQYPQLFASMYQFWVRLQ